MPTANQVARDAASPPEPHWRYKYVHEMTSEERLQSLKEWAEEKKYHYPGESGTLSLNMGALAWGGPLRTVVSDTQRADRWGGQYEAPVGPPSYEVANSEGQLNAEDKKKGPLRKWIDKRKAAKEAKRNASVPAYAP